MLVLQHENKYRWVMCRFAGTNIQQPSGKTAHILKRIRWNRKKLSDEKFLSDSETRISVIKTNRNFFSFMCMFAPRFHHTKPLITICCRCVCAFSVSCCAGEYAVILSSLYFPASHFFCMCKLLSWEFESNHVICILNTQPHRHEHPEHEREGAQLKMKC